MESDHEAAEVAHDHMCQRAMSLNLRAAKATDVDLRRHVNFVTLLLVPCSGKQVGRRGK